MLFVTQKHCSRLQTLFILKFYERKTPEKQAELAQPNTFWWLSLRITDLSGDTVFPLLYELRDSAEIQGPSDLSGAHTTASCLLFHFDVLDFYHVLYDLLSSPVVFFEVVIT